MVIRVLVSHLSNRRVRVVVRVDGGLGLNPLLARLEERLITNKEDVQ